jgi:membrane protease YdiL (CAAX protease family)
MTALWNRVPVVVRAVVTGLAFASSGTLIWAYIVSLNLRYGSSVPWSVPPAALYLWLWWKYAAGKGWPRSTAEARRDSLRAFPVSDGAWGLAILAGIFGIAAALRILNITGRFITLPEQPVPPELAQISRLTLLVVSVMGSVVAGVVEEASFRGYMQRPIERRHGPIIAIAVTSIAFWLAHFTHPGYSVLMPFYVAIGVTYGTMAYLTNSIMPGLVVHAVSDSLGSLMVLAQGQQVSSQPIPVATLHPPLWLTIAAFTVFAAATIWAFRALAATRMQTPSMSTAR